jgi:hypothetical protein
MRDVVVERFDAREVYALGDAPEVIGLELTLDVAERDQEVRVRLKECTPVVVGRDVRYRLRFTILD